MFTLGRRGFQRRCTPGVEEFRQDKSTSFVPNFFKTMANSPTAVRGTWDVYRQVGHRGVVPTALKEMIFVVISVARNCKYCESAHLAFCKVLGVDSETAAARGFPDFDAAFVAMSRTLAENMKKSLMNHPEVKLTIEPGGQHQFKYWGERFGPAITFLFPPERTRRNTDYFSRADCISVSS